MAQTHLARREEVLPTLSCHEAAPPWLAPQRLDIFVRHFPSRSNTKASSTSSRWITSAATLVYRQEAHGRPKTGRCRANGVTLIEWHFADPISEDAVRKRLDRGSVVQRWTVVHDQ